MKHKEVIGMIHLKALPTAPQNSLEMEAIYEAALADLNTLTKGGIKYAIVENLFDTPYTHKPSLDTVIAMAVLFARLKEKSKITLGLNIQATDGVEEMVLAAYAGADFIRAESFVEERITIGGRMHQMAPYLMREKKRLNATVRVLADINVKHSYPVIEQDLGGLIHEATEAGAYGIILTGLATGSAPTVDDAKEFKQICGDTPLYIGSGVSEENVADLLRYADGAIIGSSIKKNGQIDLPVDLSKVEKLMSTIDSLT